MCPVNVGVEGRPGSKKSTSKIIYTSSKSCPITRRCPYIQGGTPQIWILCYRKWSICRCVDDLDLAIKNGDFPVANY